MAEADNEAVRTYLHFRELFGASPIRRRRKRPVVGTDENAPFGRGRDPKGLGDVISGLTAEFGWTAPLAEHDVLNTWSEVVGAETAEHSEAVSIESGMLTVRCDSTAWATQLRMIRASIITSIREQFPDAGVESIRFIGPDAPSWKRGPRSVPGRGPRDTYG